MTYGMKCQSNSLLTQVCLTRLGWLGWDGPRKQEGSWAEEVPCPKPNKECNFQKKVPGIHMFNMSRELERTLLKCWCR